ncbi:hypothetical protein [Paenibacillus sp. MER TA 81-3]|uniref:hypothetical protein n=1 Tax=Paenibacillus sp. MER TA 81-3 TaxID=2939573 RepID=UPI0020418CA7|nr:hypothetical protein [Paenibacillus sp. MER TA 81-3]
MKSLYVLSDRWSFNCGMAKSMVRQEEDYADAIQETMQKAYKSLHTLQDIPQACPTIGCTRKYRVCNLPSSMIGASCYRNLSTAGRTVKEGAWSNEDSFFHIC